MDETGELAMIMCLNGGVGNQLFRYSFARSVSIAKGEDTFFHDFGPEYDAQRVYSLDAFNVKVKWIDVDRTTLQRQGLFYAEKNQGDGAFCYTREVYDTPQGCYFEGCFQTEKYFNAPVVREELKIQAPPSTQTLEVAEKIAASTGSTFIHVRRTDYTLPQSIEIHGNLGLGYYDRAMNYIRERVSDASFFVFSDDPEWCRANFTDCQVVGHNKPGTKAGGPGQEHEDIWLMSLCKNAIIPNSTFGWWGAWLGNAEIVVAPKIWLWSNPGSFKDIVPDRWVRI